MEVDAGNAREYSKRNAAKLKRVREVLPGRNHVIPAPDLEPGSQYHYKDHKHKQRLKIFDNSYQIHYQHQKEAALHS